jgi:hypothetical protein
MAGRPPERKPPSSTVYRTGSTGLASFGTRCDAARARLAFGFDHSNAGHPPVVFAECLAHELGGLDRATRGHVRSSGIPIDVALGDVALGEAT